MSKPAITEQSVGALVVQHLEAIGADVYQEVVVPGGVADIVARVVAEIWIVEIKTGWSLELLEQCLARKRQCHRVFAATVSGRNFREHTALCEALGVGVFRVQPDVTDEWDGHEIRVKCEHMPPRLTSKRLAIAGRLAPEHKTHAQAGAVGGGGRWTPWRATCEEIARFVALHPGATIKSVVDNIKHHYRTPSTARSSIATWVKAGKVPGVKCEPAADGKLALWPEPSP